MSFDAYESLAPNDPLENKEQSKKKSRRHPADVYQAPPNLYMMYEINHQFLRGERRTPRQEWTWGIIALFLSAIILFFSSDMIERASLHWQLDHGGKTTQGTVTGKSYFQGKKSTSYYVSYVFTITVGKAEGRTFSDKQYVPFEVYQRLSEGTPLTILYLPSDPSRHILGGSERYDYALKSGLGFAAFLALLWLGALYAQYQTMKRTHRLATNGQIITAFVTHAKIKRGKSGFTIAVSFVFTAPDGWLCKGRADVIRPFHASPLGSFGKVSSVAILYADRNTFQIL